MSENGYGTNCEIGMPNLNEGGGLESYGKYEGDTGGLFVPPELIQEVNFLIRDGGCVEGFARHFPMKRLDLIMRKFATGVDGYWVGAQCVKEKDAPTFEAVELHAEKMAVIVPFEDQLLEDADHDMAALIKRDVTEAFIEAIDRTFLGYEATSPFGESLSDDTPDSHDIPYGTGVDVVSDLSAAIATVENHGFEITGMIAHPRVKHILRDLRDDQNRPIYTENLGACEPRQRYCVWGIPICFTRQMAQTGSPNGTEILMAYFPYVFVGDRTGLQVAVSNEATLTQSSEDNVNLFEQDMTAYRFVIRKAFTIKDVNALAKVSSIPVA